MFKLGKITQIAISSFIVCTGFLLGTNVYASESNTYEQSEIALNGIKSEIISSPVNFFELDNVIDLQVDNIPKTPSNDKPAQIESTEKINSLLIDKFDLGNLPSDQKLSTINSRSMNYNLFQFNGKIVTEGAIHPIGPITLKPNETCQALMRAPNNPNLEYDLYLYEFDSSSGNLISPAIDISAYTGNLVDEAVGVVNKSDVAKTYYVIVASRIGASATDEFKIFISLDNEFDINEANENAFTSVGFPKLKPGSSYTLSNMTINTPVDNDWYSFYSTTSEISSLELKLDNDSADKVILELYEVKNGTELIKIDSEETTNGVKFSVTNGKYYYLKVTSNLSVEFDSPTYTLSIEPLLRPAKVSFEILVGGEPIKTSRAWPDGQERYVILNYAIMEFSATYISSSGYIAKDSVDTIYIEVVNPSWNAGTSNYKISDSKVVSDGYGKANIRLGSLYATYGIYESVNVYLTTDNSGSAYNGTMMLVKRYL